jgi:hypothetical protein
MDIGKLAEQIKDIRLQYPDNLMARYFNEAYFQSLDQSKRDKLFQVIRSGLDNPDSQMGAYAQHVTDYEEFEPLLEPMIRDYHNIPNDQEITQGHDWETLSACNLEEIDFRLKSVSMRVRVGRNVAAFPLPGAMDKAQRLQFEATMIVAFEALQEDPQYGGNYFSLSPGSPYEIDAGGYRDRVRAHQMFKDMSGDRYLNSAGISSDWSFGRGMYITRAEDFIIWVGEEDHLRIMAMKQDGDLTALFARLKNGLDKFAALIPEFAHSTRYGYITSCPTNLGSAMRASLHLPLPRLVEADKSLKSIKKVAAEIGLSVRGVGGEHSDAGLDGLVDISPSARLGISENNIKQCLYEGAAKLWALENSS